MEVTKEMREAGALFREILKSVEGKNGSVALTALGYALVASAKSIGVDREGVEKVIDQAWNDAALPTAKSGG